MSESTLLLLKGWRARWDLNPGPPAPQAGVIIRTRRRAPDTGLCYRYEPEIIKTLLTMQSNGLKQGTLRAVNYQLKYLDKNTDLRNSEQVQAFIESMKQATATSNAWLKHTIISQT
jgi:hypothetical protein